MDCDSTLSRDHNLGFKQHEIRLTEGIFHASDERAGDKSNPLVGSRVAVLQVEKELDVWWGDVDRERPAAEVYTERTLTERNLRRIVVFSELRGRGCGR